MQPLGGQLCARARFWVSLRVDGELSELEGALLDAHLARCANCAEFASGATASTAWLREAPLERPAPIVISVVSRASRRVAGSVAATAVLFAAALIAGFVHGTGSSITDQTRAVRPVVSAVSNTETPDALRRLRRTTLLNQRPVPHEYATEPA
jgi:predicted anti-sigma-YlaC factor YlaD